MKPGDLCFYDPDLLRKDAGTGHRCMGDDDQVIVPNRSVDLYPGDALIYVRQRHYDAKDAQDRSYRDRDPSKPSLFWAKGALVLVCPAYFRIAQ